MKRTPYVTEAIRREEQLKNWHRQWKINLIESENKLWIDLSEGWYDDDFRLDSEPSSE